MRRWITLSLFLFSIGLTGLTSSTSFSAQDAKSDEKKSKVPEGESEEFLTSDGVLLRGRFHPSQKGNGSQAPVVILMYAPGPDRDMTKNNWAELADDLTQNGLNVFRFDWRGHGQSKTIQDANKFWNVPLPGQAHPNSYTGPMNQKYLTSFNKNKLKQEISVRDFKNGYLPVLVNDLAAVRVHLDQKNDRGVVNTSRIYLIGEGEAATLGMIWMCSEWYRHDTDVLKGAVGMTYNVVPPTQMVQNLKPLNSRAGETIRGAIWLTPKLAPGVTQSQLINLFDPNKQPGLRQTPMLFMYGDDDNAGKNVATKYFYEQVVKADPPKASPLPRVQNTVVSTVKKTKLAGGAMLGNTQHQAEDVILKYINTILPTSAAASKQREFTFPYYVDLTFFGFKF